MHFTALSLILLLPLGECSHRNIHETDRKIHLLNFEELQDSSEYGGPRGPKNTTCSCGWTNKKSGRIFGGEETGTNEYPFVSGIIRSKLRLIFCGSSIITPHHALTAAHCFYNKTRFGPFSLVVGEHDVRTESETSVTQDIPIKKYVLHEQYNPKTYFNDIALIVLERKIEFSKLIGPVCLPNGPTVIEKQLVRTIGWGRTPTDPHGSPILQKVDLMVLPKEMCIKIMNQFYSKGSPNQMCTYSKNKSACSGDSGGPVVWLDPDTNRYVLVGIVSFGTKECASPVPRVSTDVSRYLNWIYAQLNENGPVADTCSKQD